MVRPERRTKADLAAVALITVVLLAGATILWYRSDARATVSESAATSAKDVPSATAIPPNLTEAWRAPSPATPVPVVADSTVVTGESNTVLGRDHVTGQLRWRYTRDIPLCTVGEEWGRAIAVSRKASNCSEVTSLEGSTGVRGPQRNSDADFGTRLLADGKYVTTTGNRVIETWRSDLVRTQQYGIPPALKNTNNNLKRPGCHYSSTAANDGRVGVIEKCPGDPGDRITLLKSRPQDDEKPEELLSTIVGGEAAGIVAVNDNGVAVVSRDRSELVVYDSSGSVRARLPVRVGHRTRAPITGAESTMDDRRALFWHTGTDTVALDTTKLTPMWSVPDTLGPGTSFAGKWIVPVREGLAVHDPRTGARERLIPVDRQGYEARVELKTVGHTLLEQRGATLVALR